MFIVSVFPLLANTFLIHGSQCLSSGEWKKLTKHSY